MYHGNRHRMAGGFLGGVFKTIGHVVGGAAKGFITGGPLGGIKGAVGGAVSATRRNVAAATAAAGGSFSAMTPQLRAAHAAAVARAGSGTRVIAGSTAGTPHLTGFGGAQLDMGMPMQGRRHRRMHWANTKALGRAERRIHAAVKHMTKYIKWVHPKKDGHAVPAFHHRKKRAR
jgi:hypothetical protein